MSWNFPCGCPFLCFLAHDDLSLNPSFIRSGIHFVFHTCVSITSRAHVTRFLFLTAENGHVTKGLSVARCTDAPHGSSNAPSLPVAVSNCERDMLVIFNRMMRNSE